MLGSTISTSERDRHAVERRPRTVNRARALRASEPSGNRGHRAKAPPAPSRAVLVPLLPRLPDLSPGAGTGHCGDSTALAGRRSHRTAAETAGCRPCPVASRFVPSGGLVDGDRVRRRRSTPNPPPRAGDRWRDRGDPGGDLAACRWVRPAADGGACLLRRATSRATPPVPEACSSPDSRHPDTSASDVRVAAHGDGGHP